MDQNIECSARNEAQEDDIIVLGVASVETKGMLRRGETDGGDMLLGISED